MTTCASCGTSAEGDTPPLGWTAAIERGQLRHHCVRCTREHLRSTEARLDPEWW